MPVGVEAFLGRQVVAMRASVDRPGDGQGHDRRGHLREPVADAPKAEMAECWREALAEVHVAQEPEQQGGVRAVQQLDRSRRLRRIDLVETQLPLEAVERAICLLPRRLAEMRRTVDEEARSIQRLAYANVPVEVGLGHAPNTTR